MTALFTVDIEKVQHTSVSVNASNIDEAKKMALQRVKVMTKSYWENTEFKINNIRTNEFSIK